MRVFHRWANRCIALCVFALVGNAALSRANESVTLDLGTVKPAENGVVNFFVQPQYTIYGGCLGAGTWTVGASYFGNTFAMPAENAGVRKLNLFVSSTSGGSFTLTKTGDFVTGQDVVATGTVQLALYKNGTVVDTQSIDITIKAYCKKGTGGLYSIEAKPVIYGSLKEGGPGSGKTRLPGGAIVPPAPSTDWNLLTSFPPYSIDNQGRVVDQPAPTYSLNGKTGNWGTGTNRHQVKAPTGTGVPSWAPPGSAVINDNNGTPWIVATGQPGYTSGIGGGSISASPDGSLRAWVYPTGNPAWGNDFTFPPGSPKKTDLTAPSTNPDTSNIDPCFSAAATQLGITPSSGTPVTPDLPPPGTRPDIQLPDGILAGGGPSGGGGGSGGSGTGVKAPTVTLPSGTGSGGSAPATSGGSGTGTVPTNDPTANIPLPGDGDAGKMADDLARSYAKTTGDLTTTARGLGNFGGIVPFSPGTAGDWTINFPTGSGTTVAMVIPTGHAPLVRSLLLLFVQCCYVGGIIKLLIS